MTQEPCHKRPTADGSLTHVVLPMARTPGWATRNIWPQPHQTQRSKAGNLGMDTLRPKWC
eukprot:3640099-Karenia_brevis.AAC.1